MALLMWLTVMTTTLWILAYHRASLTTFTIAATVVMVIGSLAGAISPLAWLLFLALVLPLNISGIRQQYMSLPLLKIYKTIMPQMSRTEQEALDAGTTWWEADLFCGNPDWKKLHAYPQPRLSPQEQAFLDGPVETICQMTDDWEVTHQRADLSPQVWQYLKDHQFFAMIIKKHYGGLAFSAYAQSCVLQKLSSKSSVLSSTVGVPNALGPGELLQLYGTDAQKDYYLPRLAKGLEIPCFALTNPETGSDAGAIPDVGIICKGEFEGEQVLGMRLTWNKRYITLAPVATILGLAIKLFDPDQLLGDVEELGITCALIPTDLPGVKIGRRHFTLNVPVQNGPTQGHDIFVPLSYIIGGQAMAGQGWRMLVECLSVGRAITLPSNSTGNIKALALASGAYARIRRQFKLPVGKMEGIEEPLARIGGYAYLCDAATSLSVGAIDLGEKPSVVSAIVKYHLTERMRQANIDAMDIHGGKGICLGPNNYLARGYQGAPISITVEGANILTRNLIIYGQGAIRCHPFVLEELMAARLDDQNHALKRFDSALFGHIGFVISNASRTLWLSLTNARLAKSPFDDPSKPYYQQMMRFSSTLAFVSDVAMATLGGDLKRKERTSARLGDILSMLYLTSATVKRFNDEGRQDGSLILMQWAAQDCLYKAQTALLELVDNFPNKMIGRLVKGLVFPFGPPLKKPSDMLDHKVARLMQTPSETRSLLGQGLHLSRIDNNPVGLQEQTLEDILSAEPIYDKICRASDTKPPFYHLDKVAEMGLAMGIITDREADTLRRAEAGRLKAINVDDFDPADLMVEKGELVQAVQVDDDNAAA
ncbi:MAG: acyl-CoA dehydrogenase [Alteromonadaceae bacterium]|jgi:acyl-CoA dehydrogenase